MFIERSTGRIRMARAVFVIAGLVPFVALAAWGLHLRSAAHRESIRMRWQQALGLPLEVGAVEHPRPGVVRARDCGVAGPGAVRLLDVPCVEVEAASGEDRLRIDVVRLDAAAAAALAEVAREWLCREARHPRNCIVEVADFDWTTPVDRAEAPRRPSTLRIECVSQDASRAIRVVRRDDGGGEDAVRVVRTVDDAAGRPAVAFEVEAECPQSLPLVMLAALAGAGAESAAVAGPDAVACGRFAARLDADGWAGSASGRIDHVDLAACVRPLHAAAAGEARVSVERLVWRRGRLEDAVAECVLGRGWVDTAVFERLVAALGCQPGPAAARHAGQPTRAFDEGACSMRLLDGRLQLAPYRGGPPGLATVDGGVLLNPPAAAVSFDRIAWMLSPPAATFVPAGGPGAWLMSVSPAGAESRQEPDKRAEKPSSGGGRRDF